MRIALLYPYWRRFPPDEVELAMDVVGRELPERLAARGFDVTVYSQGSGARWRTRVERGVVHRHVPTSLDPLGRRAYGVLRRLAAGRGRPLRLEDGSLLQFLSYGLLSALDMRKRGCDVAHVCIDDELLPVVRALNPGARIVLHMHDHKQAYRDRAVLADRLARADAIVGCSEFVTERVRRSLPGLANRCRTVANAVDVELYAAAAERPRGGKRLLFTGRLTPEKGVHILLEAFELVLERHPDAELVLVGQDRVAPAAEVDPRGDDPRFAGLDGFYRDPPSYARHLREISSKGARGRIRFLGSLSHDRTDEQLGAADVFVFPSIWDEPFGLPVIEALAAGVPVVATRVGGILETVEPGVTGLLCEPGDAAGLAEQIGTLLSDPARRRRMGEAARAAAVRRFAWDRRVDEWSSVYGASAHRDPSARNGGSSGRTGVDTTVHDDDVTLGRSR